MGLIVAAIGNDGARRDGIREPVSLKARLRREKHDWPRVAVQDQLHGMSPDGLL